MPIFETDLDEIRARAFVKGGPDAVTAASHAVEDRMNLLGIIDDQEQTIKEHEADIRELKDRLQAAESKLERAKRYVAKAAEVLNGL